jgi:DNA (cytosine-5)-methyltransferase 1
MRFLSLFSGIGGFDLGLERAGMVCAGQVEINPFAQLILAKHWPDVKRVSDVREVKGDEFGPIDLICGGPPCQPYSRAGERRGQDDDRHLWPEMARILRTIRPSWVVIENVADLVSLGLDDMLFDLERSGYTAQAFIIPAIALDARHRRDRLWIVSHLGGSRLPFPQQEVSPGTTTWRPNQRATIAKFCRWPTEPDVLRVAHGVPHRVDRIRSLGSAVVPQIPEMLGRAILEIEAR